MRKENDDGIFFHLLFVRTWEHSLLFLHSQHFLLIGMESRISPVSMNPLYNVNFHLIVADHNHKRKRLSVKLELSHYNNQNTWANWTTTMC